MQRKKILVVLTGGTICSSVNAEGIRYSDAKNVEIISAFYRNYPEYCDKIQFDSVMPLDILSENMTLDSWNILLRFFRSDVNRNAYNGVIVLHGTDTLAYTSSLLSLALAGFEIPVCMVSAQLPLSFAETNGHDNFRAAVELIMNGIAPNVYAVYRNSDGEMYLHYGATLLQCGNYSQDFFSREAVIIDMEHPARAEGRAFETQELLLDRMSDLTPCVLQIMPYVGLRYDGICLDGVRAIVHGTYHSQSVCVERKNGEGEYASSSVLYLLDRCREREIPVFLAPCSPQAFFYESTGDAIAHGACCMNGMTSEMAYVKTLVGCALGLEGVLLREFLDSDVNFERRNDGV